MQEGLSFIIATRWGSDALELCLKSIIEGSALKNQIIVVADRPSWQTLKLLQEDFKMIHGKDYWIVDFGHLDRSLDYGTQFADKDYICTVCDDAIFAKGWDKEIIKEFGGRKDRIVCSAYFVGNTPTSRMHKEWGYPKLKYSKNSRDDGKGIDFSALNSAAPVPEIYTQYYCKTSPVVAMSKEVYKRANGLTYFSPHPQAHEFDLVKRAEKLGVDLFLTSKTVMYHIGNFGNRDGQKTILGLSKGYFKCNVCGLIEDSKGNIEHLRTDNKGKWLEVSERGKIALETGLYLCERCKKDGWFINRKECKLGRNTCES